VFHKAKLRREGVHTRGLVLEKKIFASGYSTGRTDACRYKLRVKFEDGTTVEGSLNVLRHEPAEADVGDLIPVRYDAADHSKIEIDAEAIKSERADRERDLRERAIERGERELEQSLGSSPASGSSPPGGAQSGSAAADRRARKQALREAEERKRARRAAQLQKLDKQHAQGALTDDELAAKKAQILDRR
jgi:hypothetical protein